MPEQIEIREGDRFGIWVLGKNHHISCRPQWVWTSMEGDLWKAIEAARNYARSEWNYASMITLEVPTSQLEIAGEARIDGIGPIEIENLKQLWGGVLAEGVDPRRYGVPYLMFGDPPAENLDGD